MNPALFTNRLLAFAIDLLIIVALYSLLIWSLNAVLELPIEYTPVLERGASVKMNAFATENFYFLAALYTSAKLAVVIPYFALFESSGWQATIGKALLRLKVTDSKGERISFGRALLRLIGKWLSGQILLVGYLMAAFRRDGKALHDLIADTRVVKDN